MSLSRKELIVGMISGAVLYPVGLWLVMHHIESKVVCYTLGVMVCFILQLISFHTVYGYEFKRKQKEFEEQLAWSRKHCEKVFADSERKFDEARIYKD